MIVCDYFREEVHWTPPAFFLHCFAAPTSWPSLSSWCVCLVIGGPMAHRTSFPTGQPITFVLFIIQRSNWSHYLCLQISSNLCFVLLIRIVAFYPHFCWPLYQHPAYLLLEGTILARQRARDVVDFNLQAEWTWIARIWNEETKFTLSCNKTPMYNQWAEDKWLNKAKETITEMFKIIATPLRRTRLAKFCRFRRSSSGNHAIAEVSILAVLEANRIKNTDTGTWIIAKNAANIVVSNSSKEKATSDLSG